MVEAAALFGTLFVVGVVALLGTDPEQVGPIRAFVFFLGAPATAALQFASPGGFALAWPIDVLVWSLASVWAARAADRRGWWRRVGGAIGASALLAVIAL